MSVTTSSTSNKKILLTGASRGIGRATALALASRGHELALLGRPSAELDGVAESIRAGGGDPVVVNADVRDEGAVESAVGEARGRLGHIDVLINNAGMGRYAPFEELTTDDWEHVLAVNITGVATVLRSVLPHMREAGDGHIINVGSIRSTEVGANTSSYAASKFGLDALTRTLRLELDGTGIVVSQICPGGVVTEFGGIDPATKPQSWLQPEAIAEGVAMIIDFRGLGWVRDLTIVPEPARH